MDYANVAFNALKEIESGILTMTARRPDGAVVSRGQLNYRTTLPAAYTAEIYDRRGATLRHLAIDYSGVRFNRARRPVNSTLTIRTSDAGGNPLSATTVDYDANGLPMRRQTRLAGTGDRKSVV